MDSNGRVTIGSTYRGGSLLSFGQAATTPINKIITLYDGNSAENPVSATNFSGFGIGGNVLRYQVADTATRHVFFGGSSEYARITNTGISILTGAAPAANLQVQGNIYASNALQTTNVVTSNINVSYTANISNLVVTSNILAGPSGNTYLTGNIIVSGNVFSSTGSPLGAGGGLFLSLGSTYAVPTSYNGGVYGTTYPLTVGLSNNFFITGTSTFITITSNGNFRFSQAGAYLLKAVFNGSDNVTGLAVGQATTDTHATDQNYLYRYTTFVTQNPSELIQIPFNVVSTSNTYYLDLFMVSGATPQLFATSNTLGGTYLTIEPLQGGGVATGGPGGTPPSQWSTSGPNIYFSNSVGIGAVNPVYKLDVSGDVRATGNVYSANPILSGRTTSYSVGPLDYYIGMSNGQTVNLPLGSTLTAGKQYIIKDESGLAGTFVGYRITVATSSPDLIDGQGSAILAINYGAINVIWTGSFWSIY
jgi:hypothetical protein